uniref:Uncharacterized protein n=1 Tax=Rhizophora mucronata TaxID=61149 RepID=A0A2P2N7P9_RHIMU
MILPVYNGQTLSTYQLVLQQMRSISAQTSHFTDTHLPKLQ